MQSIIPVVPTFSCFLYCKSNQVSGSANIYSTSISKLIRPHWNVSYKNKKPHIESHFCKDNSVLNSFFGLYHIGKLMLCNFLHTIFSSFENYKSNVTSINYKFGKTDIWNGSRKWKEKLKVWHAGILPLFVVILVFIDPMKEMLATCATPRSRELDWRLNYTQNSCFHFHLSNWETCPKHPCKQDHFFPGKYFISLTSDFNIISRTDTIK